MSLLQIKDFGISFGKTEILKNINFELREGEIISLLGPSGCGKSTILRAICGLEQKHEGEIYINSKCVSSKKIYQNVEKRKLGYIFQDFALFPHLNVEQNIGFGLIKSTKEEKRIKVAKLLRQFELEEQAKKPIHQLSGGQQQRVAIARVLALNPKIILLDEPFSNLDTLLRNRTKLWLQDIIKKFKVSAILVTHDQKEALNISDKIGIIQDKTLVQFDTPKDLYLNPKNLYCAKFLGELNVFGKEFLKFFPKSKGKTLGKTLALRVKNTNLGTRKNDFALEILSSSFCGDYYELKVKCLKSKLDIHLISKDLPDFSKKKFYLDFSKKDLMYLNI